MADVLDDTLGGFEVQDKQDDELVVFQANLLKRKKRPKKPVKDDQETGEAEQEQDYPFVELLDRLFTKLRREHPTVGEKKQTKLPPPSILRMGKRLTWANFPQTCTLIGRRPDHVMTFMLAELGCDGNLDGESRLVIRGRYMPKQLESLLGKYIREYVTCHTCRSLNTSLVRDSVSRLLFVSCAACKSQHSAAPIKSYRATTRVDRRAAKEQA